MKWFLFSLMILTADSAFAGRYCNLPWGGTLADGLSVRAFREQRAVNGNRCESEYRYCRDGYLSGWYRYQRCTEDLGCNTEFGYLYNGQSITAYLNPQESGGRRCQSETRTCSYGRFSGSYHYRSCSENP